MEFEKVYSLILWYKVKGPIIAFEPEKIKIRFKKYNQIFNLHC